MELLIYFAIGMAFSAMFEQQDNAKEIAKLKAENDKMKQERDVAQEKKKPSTIIKEKPQDGQETGNN